MLNYIDEFAWYRQYEAMNRFSNNPNKRLLIEYSHSIYGKTFPTQLEIAKKASRLAQFINEPFWFVYFEVMKQDCLHQLKRFDEWYDSAIHLVFEIRKAEYRLCTYRAKAYLQLVMATYHLNPIDQVEQILESIAFTIHECSLERETHLLLLDYRSRIYIGLENWDKAHEATADYQYSAAENAYHYAQSSIYLAQIAFHLKIPTLLKEQATLAAKLPNKKQSTFFPLAGMYWLHVYSLIYGDSMEQAECLSTLEEEVKLNKNKLYELYEEKPSFLAVAEFYQAIHRREEVPQYYSKNELVPNMSPFESKKHLLRLYVIASICPEREMAANIATNAAWQEKSFPLLLAIEQRLGEGVMKVFLVIGLILYLVPVYFVLAKPIVFIFKPQKRVLLRLRSLTKRELETEFFEDRIRWIDENRQGYIP